VTPHGAGDDECVPWNFAAADGGSFRAVDVEG
jgi:hypothetical protein